MDFSECYRWSLGECDGWTIGECCRKCRCDFGDFYRWIFNECYRWIITILLLTPSLSTPPLPSIPSQSPLHSPTSAPRCSTPNTGTPTATFSRFRLSSRSSSSASTAERVRRASDPNAASDPRIGIESLCRGQAPTGGCDSTRRRRKEEEEEGGATISSTAGPKDTTRESLSKVRRRGSQWFDFHAWCCRR